MSCRGWIWGVLLLCAALFVGCGRGSSDEVADDETETSEEVAADEEEDTGSTTTARRRKKPAKKKGPHLGGIPLDAFADRPIVTVATPSAAPSPAPSAAPAPMPAATVEAAAAASGGWDALITAEDVQSEIKHIRQGMSTSLMSVSKYNGAYKGPIPQHMSVLAALAAIVAEQNMDISWKPDAIYIRDMAAEVQSKANGLGNEPFEATQKAWEELDAFLSGNKPVKLPESAPRLPFSEVTKRSAAMRRMEHAFNTLKQNFGSADDIKKDPEKATHEAAILATLTRIIGMEGYDLADDEEYKGYVQALEKSNAELLASIKSGDFTAFSDSLSRANRTCGECHTSFKP